MTLGLTDGTYFGGLGEHAKLCTCDATYGAPIGSSQTYSSWPNTSVGVTTNSIKSGLVGVLPTLSLSSRTLGKYFIRF